MCFFFFNDTATTEIYPYCHTLSRHDALPILAASNFWGSSSNIILWYSGKRKRIIGLFVTAFGTCVRKSLQIISSSNAPMNRQKRKMGNGRSEEHTSELQSLMRNSYAVFCLKKTKKIHNKEDKSMMTVK